MQGLPRVSALAAGRCWGAAAGADGSVWVWGCRLGSGSGAGPAQPAQQAVRVAGFGRGARWRRAVALAGGEYTLAVVTADGLVPPTCEGFLKGLIMRLVVHKPLIR